jgi:protein SCO1/2
VSLSQGRRITLTVGAVLLFVVVVVVSFVHRIQQPRIMSQSEMQANGLFLFKTPRDPGDFDLVRHDGTPFTAEDLEGQWSLLFFGFTHCPDVCPTTMQFLAELHGQLQGTEAEDTQVIMISVDPSRDTVEALASYVPYFHPDFVGVTGDFPEIMSFAHKFNAPFRKVMTNDDSYQVEHSANVALVNPRGDYHGFFKSPRDLAKMKVTYRSARYLWDE